MSYRVFLSIEDEDEGEQISWWNIGDALEQRHEAEELAEWLASNIESDYGIAAFRLEDSDA